MLDIGIDVILHTLTALGGLAQHKSPWRVLYSDHRAPRAIGTLSTNPPLNSRGQKQRLIRREATKVSGQEMETQKGNGSARSGIAAG